MYQPTKPTMNYMLNTLPEIIAQVVHFSRDDYQNGEYPDDCAWNAGYIVACLLAQHTVEGGSGVETEQGYAGMKVTEDMPYDERVRLAKQLVDYWGGAKPQPAGALAESAAQGAALLHEARMTLSMLEAMTSGDPEKPYRPSRDAMAYVRTRTAKLRAALADDTAHSVTATAVGWITGTGETTV